MAEQQYTQEGAANDLLDVIDRAERANAFYSRPSRQEATDIILRLLRESGHGAVVALYRRALYLLPDIERSMLPDSPWIIPDTTAEVGCAPWGWMVNPKEVADG